MNSLPAQIFNDVRQAQDRIVERAWGAALTLVLMILLLTLVARLDPAKEPTHVNPEQQASETDTPEATDEAARPQSRAPRVRRLHATSRDAAGRRRGTGASRAASRSRAWTPTTATTTR